jgi:tRNA-dihydrouridine synthase A
VDHIYRNALQSHGKVLAVAPMLDWTDRHYRYLARLLSKRALLYTEMVVADAIIHGDRERLLGFDASEHPVALQLGGSDPAKLAEAVRIAADFGYDEINLNVGCPSDRVQSGTFGACLMQTPDVVARAVAAMKAVSSVPVTVKCRIGVDDQEPEEALPGLVVPALDAGADAIWVHARKAWLQGLSPRENREIPPLDYGIVYRLKQRFPHVFIGINGGILTLEAAGEHLQHVDGVMIGRAAYQNTSIMADVDAQIFGDSDLAVSREEVLERMSAYCADVIQSGGKLSTVTRHMLGLFHGMPGARRYRQILSTDGPKPGAGVDVLVRAFDAMQPGETALSA